MKAIVLNAEEFSDILKKERETLLNELMRLSSTTERDKKLNAKQAAEFLGISLSTLYKRVKDLPHKKFGKKLIFNADELQHSDFSSLSTIKNRPPVTSVKFNNIRDHKKD